MSVFWFDDYNVITITKTLLFTNVEIYMANM